MAGFSLSSLWGVAIHTRLSWSRWTIRTLGSTERRALFLELPSIITIRYKPLGTITNTGTVLSRTTLKEPIQDSGWRDGHTLYAISPPCPMFPSRFRGFHDVSHSGVPGTPNPPNSRFVTTLVFILGISGNFSSRSKGCVPSFERRMATSPTGCGYF